METPRILITGINGQVGFELKTTLAPLGEIFALDRAAFDLNNPAQMQQVLDEIKPTIIVNPAACTAVDKAESEPELAYAINAEAPKLLAEWAKLHNALLIHYSTDYVFEGTGEQAYSETDSTNPQSVYGASKLKGEQYITATGAKHMILRTSWVYGVHGNNFIKTMLRLAGERDTLNIVADQIGAPTSAHFIATVTEKVIETYLNSDDTSSLYGIYHLTPRGETSWYNYAKVAIAQGLVAGKTLACKLDNILPINSHAYPTPAKRPLNSRLNCQKLYQTFAINAPDWQTDVTHTVNLILDQH